MRRLSDATSRVASQNFSRKFVSLGRIVKAWDEIMGAKFAGKAVPRKINYRKPTGRRQRPEAILEIATSSADATLLHYQADLILQRMEHVFGERWITGVKFVACDTMKSAVKVKKARKPLTGEQKNHLSEMLGALDDSELQSKLQTLGEGIFTR